MNKEELSLLLSAGFIDWGDNTYMRAAQIQDDRAYLDVGAANDKDYCKLTPLPNKRWKLDFAKEETNSDGDVYMSYKTHIEDTPLLDLLKLYDFIPQNESDNSSQ